MKGFIQIGNVIINKKDIQDVHFEDSKEFKGKFDMTIQIRKGKKWTCKNYSESETILFKRELFSINAHEKLMAIKSHIIYKSGRKSKSDNEIMNIINH